jgi:prepilin-type N-terminal cleavage/methylation domain-containing protein
MDRRTARDLVSVKRAFTLIELMVAILIISILLALVVPNFVLMQERARRSAVKNNMHIVYTAIEAFAVDHGGSYPGFIGETDNWKVAAGGDMLLWFPGGDPIGIDGEPVPGNLPVNPYDGKRYNADGKPTDLEYEDLVGELEYGQNDNIRGDDDDCPYIDFGYEPAYPGGIGVATFVPESGPELPTEYGIYGFGRDVTYPMYDLDPGSDDPSDEENWVFFVLHN